MRSRQTSINFAHYDLIHIECGEHFIEWDAENFVKHMEWLSKDIDSARELRDLKQNLKGIEWVCDDGQQCPVCGGTWVHNVGHKPGCWLAATIGEGGGGEG